MLSLRAGLLMLCGAANCAQAAMPDNHGPREAECIELAASVIRTTGATAEREFAFRYMMRFPGREVLPKNGLAVECDAKDATNALDRVEIYVPGTEKNLAPLINVSLRAIPTISETSLQANTSAVIASCIAKAQKTRDKIEISLSGFKLSCLAGELIEIRVSRRK